MKARLNAASRGLAAQLARNVDELLLLVALALVARGFLELWRPAAWLVPGLVLLWIVLPTRRAFVVDDTERRKG